MTEPPETNESGVDEPDLRLDAYYKDFLKRLVDIQPIAFLFSASVVVATFFRDGPPNAYEAALAAAFGFGLSLLASAITIFTGKGGPKELPELIRILGLFGAAAGFAYWLAVLVYIAASAPPVTRLAVFTYFEAVGVASLPTVVRNEKWLNLCRGQRIERRERHLSFGALRWINRSAAAAVIVGPMPILLEHSYGLWLLTLISVGLVIIALVAVYRSRRNEKPLGGEGTPR